MNKTYVLYHGQCPDGMGAALAAYLTLGNEAEYIPVNYGNPIPPIDDGSRVYIVDFSYPREQLLELKSRTDLIVLDHHATAQKDLEGLDFCQFDMDHSGAVMTWRFFNPTGPIPDFFLYLQDRDLWKFELPDSREVSAAVRSHPMTLFHWTTFWRDVEILKLEGVACLRIIKQQVEIMAAHHRWARFDLSSVSDKLAFADACGTQRPEEGWHYAPVANATVFFSEVGERLLEMNPDAPFAAYYLDRKDGKRQWGLRSRPDFDCSVIAKAFGGGGHKQAAGFIQIL